MENLITYTNYETFKAALDTEVKKVSEGFVKIGYLLNKAAETDILMESGYANVKEFAMAEYKLEESQVSRFINIYKEFGIMGRPELQEQYRSHGVAKLGMMLKLPSHIREEIPASYSKSEINVLKKEIEEEQKISDIEVMLEEKDNLQQCLPEGLKQAVMQLIHSEPERYVRMYESISMDDFKESVSPNGEDSYIIRVPGVGKLIIFVKASDEIVITNVRTGEKEQYTWEQLFDAAKEYFAMGSSAKESWSNVFQEPYPEKGAAAIPQEKSANTHNNNVEQEKPKKENRVKVIKPASKCEKKEEKSEETQLPGQDSVLNHPEYLPEGMDMQQSSEEIAPVQENKTITGYKAAISGAINRMRTLFDEGKWDKLIVEADKVSWRAQQIKKMGEK